MKVQSRSHRTTVLLVCLIASFAITSCDRPPIPVPVADYRMQHRIYAKEKVFSLIVPVSSSGRLATDLHRQKIMSFASDYLRRGYGPLLVTRNVENNSSKASYEAIANALFSIGVPKKDVFFQARTGQGGSVGLVELSFSGYIARVPQCGDWSGHTGFDPNNLPHTNFGCSYQRNVGLMLSDPGNLSVEGGRLQHDSDVSNRVTKTYRGGKQMGTKAPTLEQKDFADLN